MDQQQQNNCRKCEQFRACRPAAPPTRGGDEVLLRLVGAASSSSTSELQAEVAELRRQLVAVGGVSSNCVMPLTPFTTDIKFIEREGLLKKSHQSRLQLRAEMMGGIKNNFNFVQRTRPPPI